VKNVTVDSVLLFRVCVSWKGTVRGKSDSERPQTDNHTDTIEPTISNHPTGGIQTTAWGQNFGLVVNRGLPCGTKFLSVLIFASVRNVCMICKKNFLKKKVTTKILSAKIYSSVEIIYNITFYSNIKVLVPSLLLIHKTTLEAKHSEIKQ